MSPQRVLWTLGVFFTSVAAVPAQSALPSVGDVDVPQLRANVRRLLAALDQVQAPLPGATEQALRRWLSPQPGEEAAEVADRIQELLDPMCLIGIAINPESRVKAARGLAAAALHQGRDGYVLVKLHNDAGVTQPLTVTGGGRWLRAAVVPVAAKGALSGARLEYLLLRLRPLESGKREATLQFDVGQGTQDLGFRAEVPILFRVREP